MIAMSNDSEPDQAQSTPDTILKICDDLAQVRRLARALWCACTGDINGEEAALCELANLVAEEMGAILERLNAIRLAKPAHG